jgi:GH15 family glucan-1,4-alpha-glucosidase
MTTPHQKRHLQLVPALDPDVHALVRKLVEDSLRIIRENQHDSGAYVACPHFASYRYCWFRDGSFIADAMSRVGDYRSAEAFFDWCARVLLGRAAAVRDLIERGEVDAVSDEELLRCRFTIEGEADEVTWEHFQLDGYGTWLWALSEHLVRSGRDVKPAWHDAAQLTSDYLEVFWRRPCADWWEEHPDKNHVSTLAALYAGLRCIARAGVLEKPQQLRALLNATAIRDQILWHGVHDSHLCKWLGTSAIDGSLLACIVPFDVVDPPDPVARETVHVVEQTLLVGGVHRYLGDIYYGGGEWLLLSALLGWNQLAQGRRADALAQLCWIADQANPAGELPEHVAGTLVVPRLRAEWIERAGPVASPLLGSHAMFLTLATELGVASDGSVEHAREG